MAGVILPKRNFYATKDQLKSDKANKFIGRGSFNSSTEGYRRAWAEIERANVGEYTSSDVVFVSAEGQRRGRFSPPYEELMLAVDAGATLLTDDKRNRERPYNVGEREVVDFLVANNYTEVSPGVWQPKR